MSLTLKVKNIEQTLASATAQEEVWLDHPPEYTPGDCVSIESDEAGRFILLQLDDAMPAALVYLKETTYTLPIPFEEKKIAYSPRSFAGDRHLLYARYARPEEIALRRNMAFNPYDGHENTTLFPHASANVETRGESVFAARNAIDGAKGNHSHGAWPFQSWGINRDPAAALRLEFGRPVVLDEAVLYLRADFPHDAWWEAATLHFSDGSSLTVSLVKSGAAQSFIFPARTVEWVVLDSLIKADDPSPFPALTQLELFGREAE